MDLLDLWRSLCVLIMVIYHLAYDLAAFGALPEAAFGAPWLRGLTVAVSGSFVFIAGVSSRFSRSNVRRGVLILAAAVLVSLVTTLLGDPIRFGALHLMGLAMILYGLTEPFWQRLPEKAAPWLYLSLAAGTLLLTKLLTPRWDFLYFLGFHSEAFYSADYVPLFPWLFVYLLGAWLGGRLIRNPESRWRRCSVPAALTWPGRHSLLIYLLHQPVLYGACYLIFNRGG